MSSTGQHCRGYMSNELDLGYDLFDAVMHSRERQAENMDMTILGLGILKHISHPTHTNQKYLMLKVVTVYWFNIL